ncbi:MAG: C10 family peptidase, partial [Bacteroidaceae bacterium]|nr:C10 family peptidase [Bacteroidaceae bacterium]
GGGSDAGGHAFVCDGYDTVDFVHINWGWGGRYDGYYAIHLLDGGGYQFSDDQSIIVGIMPDFTGVDTLDIQIPPCVMDAPRVKGDLKSVKVGGSGDTFYIDFDSVYNRNPYSNDYMYGVGLYDKNGNFVEEASVNSTSNTFFLQAWYGFVAFTSDRGGITCKLKNSYNAGDYTLRLIFKQKNTETGVFFDGWALPYMKGGDANNQIPVYIHDGNAYFHQVSSAINDIEGEGAQVKSVQLYDVEGREILSPKDGQLVIEKQTLYNGKTKTFKRVAH